MSKQFVYSKGFDKFVKSKRLKGDGVNNDKILNKQANMKIYLDRIASTIDKNRITLVTSNTANTKTGYYGLCCGYDVRGFDVDLYIVPKDKTYNSELWKRVYIARGLSNFDYSWRSNADDNPVRIAKTKGVSENSKIHLSSGDYDENYISFLCIFGEYLEAFNINVEVDRIYDSSTPVSTYTLEYTFTGNSILETRTLELLDIFENNQNLMKNLKGDCDDTVDKLLLWKFTKIRNRVKKIFDELNSEEGDVNENIKNLKTIVNNMLNLSEYDNRITKFIEDYSYLNIMKEKYINYCDYCGQRQSNDRQLDRKERKLRVKKDSKSNRLKKKRCCELMMDEDMNVTMPFNKKS
jgi:hypothetical protein